LVRNGLGHLKFRFLGELHFGGPKTQLFFFRTAGFGGEKFGFEEKVWLFTKHWFKGFGVIITPGVELFPNFQRAR